MARGLGGGAIIQGRQLSLIFPSKGVIIRGRRLIEGRQLFEEIRYAISSETILLRMHINVQLTKVLEISEALDSISKAH